MEIEILNSANPNIVVFLLTTLVAFISWLVKSLFESPIKESKETFNQFVEKRIEILGEIKVLLSFISFFPIGDEGLDYKDKLQQVLLKDGKACYLDNQIYNNVLKISIDSITNEGLLLNTISDINADLESQIFKVREEMNFYKRYSNYNPFKKSIGYLFLFLQYVISLVIVITLISLFIFGLMNYIKATVITVVSISVLYFIFLIYKKYYLKKK